MDGMSNEHSNLTSAQVVLGPQGVASAADVIAAFVQAGFRTGALVANNFSITASQEHFERYFQVRLEFGTRGEMKGVHSSHRSAQGLQLPVEGLPPDLRSKVQMILFSPPPAFGPTGSFA
jgi:hypothetical protein